MLSYISNIIMQFIFITYIDIYIYIYIYIDIFFFYFASFIAFAKITHERLIKDVNMMNSEMITSILIHSNLYKLILIFCLNNKFKPIYWFNSFIFEIDYIKNKHILLN